MQIVTRAFARNNSGGRVTYASIVIRGARLARSTGGIAVPSDISHKSKCSVASTQETGKPVRILDVARSRCTRPFMCARENKYIYNYEHKRFNEGTLFITIKMKPRYSSISQYKIVREKDSQYKPLHVGSSLGAGQDVSTLSAEH